MRVKEDTRANRSGDYSYRHAQTSSTHAHETRARAQNYTMQHKKIAAICIFSQKNEKKFASVKKNTYLCKNFKCGMFAPQCGSPAKKIFYILVIR